MRRRAVLALLLIAGFICAPATAFVQDQDVDVSRETGFVFRACENLEKYFYDSEKVVYSKLLNAALKGISEVLENQKTEYRPELMDEAVPPEEAKKHFEKELKRAKKISQKIEGLGHNDLMFGATEALLDSMDDSHTGFVSPEWYNEDRSGFYYGIGAAIRRLEKDFYFIPEVYESTPAEAAGLKKLDRLLEVDGTPIPDDLKEIINKIRGERGTEVELTVERKGERLKIKIRRQRINMPDMKTEILREKEGVFGYLQLYNFIAPSFFFEYELKKMLKQNPDLKGIILGLRGNAGGYVSTVQLINSLFFPNETLIFTSKGRDGISSYRTMGDPLTELPIAVLINEGSASGSELTAAAFQEHKRAVIVGEKSSGSVSVGTELPLYHGAHMRVTVAQAFTPSGKTLEKNGVQPDVEVKITKEYVQRGEDGQLQKAVEELKKKIKKDGPE